ncbi:MAG: aminotransferase class I/II-fold pyridoxal phosphate-dependent enzyme [Chlorobi bacterium]|nr:aminotransferase class I/II-fold pyridoxal phosphate-dependent enzyme [Chlorobiota bacterium]MCI0717357.1 aminotransferase class I/II-fold pyridoxal phosphate-dependent enzyme [Chlorobiota bacterium]
MISIKDLNPNLLNAEYAVRGPIVIRAQELEKQGKKIIYCNIGNPQALKQKPLTYIRQILSLMEYPDLLNHSNVNELYPKDIIERAKHLHHLMPHGTGAYTQSAGMPFIRQAVAEFIQKRDGIPTDESHIILTDGASKGVSAVLIALMKNKNDGFMIPIPQYPLYSATIELYGASQIGYFLDEGNSWQLNEEILTKSLTDAKTKGINPLAIAVINPGNPTGAVLSYENIVMIINFAKKHNLSIMADEVYQDNVYVEGGKFHSFAKVMHTLGENSIPLFSFHSVSKGYMGECGHRGGYLELRNIPDDVLAEFIKLQSISLCSNTVGQLVTYLVVTPPQKGDESYGLFVKERDGILNDLKTKAEILGKGLNEIDGMTIEVPQGALYAFVKLELPHTGDVSKMSPAERLAYDTKRDNDYCMALLEETGICVVPGSGFGQLPGTLHFRTTFLPPKDEIEELVKKMKEFHGKYVSQLVINN